MKLDEHDLYLAFIALGGLMTAAVAFDLVVRARPPHTAQPRWNLAGVDTQAGRIAIQRYGCGACHVIPGIGQASGRVGPQLHGFVDQTFIAGLRPNTPDDLIQWLQNPQAISPQTAMPNLSVNEADARAIAAYLYAVP